MDVKVLVLVPPKNWSTLSTCKTCPVPRSSSPCSRSLAQAILCQLRKSRLRPGHKDDTAKFKLLCNDRHLLINLQDYNLLMVAAQKNQQEHGLPKSLFAIATCIDQASPSGFVPLEMNDEENRLLPAKLTIISMHVSSSVSKKALRKGL
jgi:hypothetical protein